MLIEEVLFETLRFETLVTELSAAFASLSPNEVDREIDKWLQTLVEFLGVDRASFFQFREDSTTLYLGHSYTVPGIEPLSLPPIGINEQFPWITDQLRRGNTIKWSHIPDDLPEQAAKEKKYAATTGAKSVLNIPVLVGGSVICTISFTSIGIYRDWPDETVARLRLVGEIFAAAVERKRAEALLQAKETERKRGEQSQRESQLKYETLVQSINGIVWEADPQTFTFTFVSKQAERILGYPLEQWFEGPSFWPDHMHRDDRDWAVKYCVDATARGEDHQFEYRMIAADGRVVWLNDIVSLHIAADQSVILRGLMVDITEQKLANEKLRQSETQMAEAQRLAKVGSWNWDIRNNIHTWSGELYHMYGLDPQESEPSYDTFIELVHPDDRAAIDAVVEHALNAQETINSYLRIIRPDGVARIFHSRGNTISDSSGTPIRMYGTVQDVTERKQAEEAQREAEQKYREIFENAGEGIFQSTPDGKYIAANPALARMYGFASPEELIHSCQDISRQVYVDPARREEFKRRLEEQGVVRGFELEVFRKDGSTPWISVNAHAVRDEEGAIQYYEGTAQDISERKAAEGKLKATNEQLRALSASLQSAREEEGTRIARELHDEMGSSLTTLRWGLDDIDSLLAALAPEVDTDTLREKIATMTTLVEGTLQTVRRISLELRPGILDDLGLMSAIDWEAQQFQARSGIACHFDSSVEKVQLTRAYSIAIFRILQEALTNVLRHAAATRVEVAIMEAEGTLVLTISDDGRGITDEEKSGSQSLGLLGMRERAVLFGGEVNITGVENQGTVVTVRIPS